MDREQKISGLPPGQHKALSQIEDARRRGESLRGYAKRHQLSEGALYQAARALRRKGLLEPSSEKATPVKNSISRKARFVKLKTVASSSGRPEWRVRFPNGAVLEGQSEIGPVLEALARI